MQAEHQSDGRERDSSYFRNWWKYDGFWSCCGLDGLSVVFALPLESITGLQEPQKQSLMRLLERLASATDETLVSKVAALDHSGPEQRLQALLEMSSHLAE